MGQNKGYLTAKTDKASDEYYTPPNAITPLLKYVSKEDIIWCPFDKENSKYVQIFLQNGNKVIFSHIDLGKNFFYYSPDKYDIIISNPPFSCKDDILKRLEELQKPYAMLFPLPTLQGQKRFPYLQNKQALIFDKRINFYQDEDYTKIVKGVSFASIYICNNFLPKDLIFEELLNES
jgi:hypothetical protein